MFGLSPLCRLYALHSLSFAARQSFSTSLLLHDLNSRASLYPGHIQLNPVQRALLAAGSGVLTLLNPYRDDLLATYGEITGQCALKKMHLKMMEDPVGKEILSDRPRIRTTTVDYAYLRNLPVGTLGKNYTLFMDHYGYSPDARRLVRFVDDPDLAYVMLRYREIHDLVHTLLEQPTDLLGEVVVKWVEGLQTQLPMCLTGGFFGALRLGSRQTNIYLSTHLSYAIRVGRYSENLMCVYYERHWEDNILDLREKLRIPPPPRPYDSRNLLS